jgi:hypothetical protein
VQPKYAITLGIIWLAFTVIISFVLLSSPNRRSGPRREPLSAIKMTPLKNLDANPRIAQPNGQAVSEVKINGAAP